METLMVTTDHDYVDYENLRISSFSGYFLLEVFWEAHWERRMENSPVQKNQPWRMRIPAQDALDAKTWFGR